MLNVETSVENQVRMFLIMSMTNMNTFMMKDMACKSIGYMFVAIV